MQLQSSDLVRVVMLVIGCLAVDAKADPNTGQRQIADSVAARRMIAQCPPVAFIKRAGYGMKGTNAIMFAKRTGRGAAICIYDPAKPEDGERTIFSTTEGFIFNMNPSYDGRRIVFSYKVDNVAPFHIWEIGVDGSGLRQLTDGPYHDFSPVYYPDGRIVFSSSRVESYSLCQDFLACALYAMDGDGSNLRRIDFTTLCTLTPSVLQDGSILCTRWEYNDKNIFAWQGLWTINPDGRQLRLYHGNTFRIPNAVYGGREIPGTNQVLVVWSAHHRVPIGDLAIVDRSRGLETYDSMWKVTNVTPVQKELAAGTNWRASGVGSRLADTLFERAFADPYPFTSDLSLVSFGGDDPIRHHLYILNHRSGDTCLLHATDGSCFSPIPLSERPLPQTIPGDCPQEPGEGVYLVQDVYQGLREQGVSRGQVAALRIMSQVPKKYNTEGPRYHDHYPIVGQGSYYVKYNHGTVPVEADGSALFKAPSNTELYFIALDRAGKELQRMGSVAQITTGEVASCVGCHEHRASSPATQFVSVAANRRPKEITPPPWGAGPVDFVKQVQPILDQYCVRCHDGPMPDGGINLSGDKTRFYNMAYESLVFRDYVDYYYINQGPSGNFPALSTGSWVSKLTDLLESKHGGVAVDEQSRRCIYAWIDANVPYYGTWEMTRPHTTGGRDAYGRTLVQQADGRQTPQVQPWVADYLRFWEKQGPVGDKYAILFKGIPSRPSEINLTHPAWSPVLRDNLAASAGGRAADGDSLFSSADDPSYRELLGILEQARDALEATPRIDMPSAAPIAQKRDFGRTF